MSLDRLKEENVTNANGRNGIKLKFTAAQIITIVILIAVLAVTFASKADKAEVQAIREDMIRVETNAGNVAKRLSAIDTKLDRINEKLDKLAAGDKE